MSELDTQDSERARRGPPALISYRELAYIREALARLDEKIDASLALRSEVDDIEKRVRALELELAKTGGTKAIITWVANAAVALAAAILGAAGAIWFH